jgi:hypothetical protein
MQRNPRVRRLVMSVGWLCLAACGSRNENLFDGVVAPPVDEPVESDPVVVEPAPVIPPVVMETPMNTETPNEGLPLTPPPPPPVMMMPPPPPEPVEPEGPRIVSVSPEDGARGVSNDVRIVITFSVPMDPAQTQAAYQSEGVPSGDVSFDWNDDNTVLTIIPDAPLAYPTGTDPDAVQSEPINFFISGSARDEDGNRLAGPAEFSFSLLRQINLSLSAEQDRNLTGNWRSNDTYGQGTCARNQPTICVGDTGANRDQYKGFMSFDLGDLPSDMSRLASARLNLQITQRPGNPFNGLGALFLDHAEFDEIGPGAFDVAPLSELGSIATAGNAGTVIQVDVRSAIAADLGNRDLSQFRLEFEEITDDDGNADTLISTWDTQRIDVSYLIP